MEQQKREYGLFTAIAMIVGIVIGSGIFFKSDDMLGYTGGNVGLAVLVFCIAAFTIVFGCLTFSQLAALTDKPGGVITYANEFMGKRWACLFGWFQVFVYYPTLTVLLCWVVGIYVGLTMGWDLSFAGMVGIGLIWFFLCFLYNIFSAKIGGIFQEATVVIKLIPLFAIALAGLIFGDPIAAIQNPSPEAIEATKTLGWAAAIGPIAFSFDGWVISTAVAHEVKDAKHNMPRALVAAPLFVLAAYLMYFLGICGYLGADQVMALGDSAVAEVAANLISPAFASVIFVFVTISVMGTANGIILGYIRLPYSLALRNAIPGSNSVRTLNKKLNMPVNSAVFAMAVSGVWWVIHYLQNKYNLLINGDIAEIAIAVSYLLYIFLYYQVFKLWRKGVIKSVKYGVVYPLFAVLGSLFVLIGGLANPQFIIFVAICLISIIGGYLYGGKASDDVQI
ncbi:APC family permease [Sinanaerobacter chloroacetimidivorans]|uniref:APC family permease n=1 Tax=Sinanaerobacter chloroacetimidivorans TaxID=2818044 RepID=A0A8J8B1U1_9FIRM|nr:APC family permease [Sinanaerobacter chloroacetimidivorans]MBR0598031.1 APC family permease [Sinanaerobacter chloroacetimidivorans]